MKHLILLAGSLLVLLSAGAAGRKPAGNKSPGREVPPSFMGGDVETFQRWVIGKLRFPADSYRAGDKGEVSFWFTVERDGSLTDLKFEDKSDLKISGPVLLEVMQSPPWAPGMRNGKLQPVRLRTDFQIRLVPPPAGEEDPVLYAEDDFAYTEVDVLPAFCGGGAKVFRKWLQGQVDSLAEPDVRSDPQRLVVRFIVERDGSMTYDRKETPTESSLKKTIRGILAEGPAWTPALRAGEKVRYKVAIPVAFGPGADEALYADEDAFQAEEVMPQFKGGGIDKFRIWVMRTISYPRPLLLAGMQGRVVASFVVDREGKVTSVEIQESSHLMFSKEVERCLGRSPKWKPGTEDGRPVAVKFTLPVDFRF